MKPRHGIAHNAFVVVAASLVALGLLIWLLANPPQGGQTARTGGPQPQDGPSGTPPAEPAKANGDGPERFGSEPDTLLMYCAAGIRPAVEPAAKAYEREFGVRIQLNFAGSGALLGTLQIQKKGDLYLVADTSYIQIAREKKLLDEAIPLARQRPVIAVRKGNPKKIHSIQDLLRSDVQFMLANPELASIGKLVQNLLEKTGEWDAVRNAVKTLKPTVNEVLVDVKNGFVDAGVLWDANVNQHPQELEMVRVPVFDEATQEVFVGVLKTCKQPAAALRFARYLQAPTKGQLEFQRYGYETINGDEWAEQPKLLLFSGGVNRLAIQDTLREFELREGVDIDAQYNGCGFLTSLINGGQFAIPDLYFACDVSFMTMVQDKFRPALTLSETPMILITKKGNPKNLGSIRDLAEDGLKLGVANPAQSTLGALTRNLFEQIDVGGQNLYEAAGKNFKVHSPTADFLVTQLLEGGLDAAIVYKANVAQVRDQLEVIEIHEGDPIALQPIAVSKTTKYPFLAQRLVEALTSRPSQERFRSVGFGWRADAGEP